MPHEPTLSPYDAERLQRWRAAGRPPIPLNQEPSSGVPTLCANVGAALKYLALPPSTLDTVRRWIDVHC